MAFIGRAIAALLLTASGPLSIEARGAVPGSSAPPACSTTACPSTCQCIEQHCAAEITACLSDPSCATGQSCIEQCKCGDSSCLATCAMKTPSPKGLAMLRCAKGSC